MNTVQLHQTNFAICENMVYFLNHTCLILNVCVSGITNEIFIDDNGDRDTSYTVLDMDPRTGQFRVSTNYNSDLALNQF